MVILQGHRQCDNRAAHRVLRPIATASAATCLWVPSHTHYSTVQWRHWTIYWPPSEAPLERSSILFGIGVCFHGSFHVQVSICFHGNFHLRLWKYKASTNYRSKFASMEVNFTSMETNFLPRKFPWNLIPSTSTEVDQLAWELPPTFMEV